MNKLSKIAVLCFALYLICAPVMVFAVDAFDVADTATEAAAETGTVVAPAAPVDLGLGKIGAAIGCGLVIIGGSFGIARIGAGAVESMARQPELAGAIQTAMIIAAALIEGVTFFALIICMMCR